jgi:hypothetical protein
MPHVADLDDARTGQPARAAEQVDALPRQPAFLARVGVVRHHEISPGQHGCNVHVGTRAGLACALYRLARAEQ